MELLRQLKFVIDLCLSNKLTPLSLVTTAETKILILFTTYAYILNICFIFVRTFIIFSFHLFNEYAYSNRFACVVSCNAL